MAEKNIIMQRKKADGTYDTFYPKQRSRTWRGLQN